MAVCTMLVHRTATGCLTSLQRHMIYTCRGEAPPDQNRLSVSDRSTLLETIPSEDAQERQGVHDLDATGDPSQPSTTTSDMDAGAADSANTRIDAEGARGSGKHVALAFYGLSRSLSYTIGSIEEHIFSPLRAAGHTFDVYLHTYDLEVIEGGRSEKSDVALNTTEWQLLQPDVHSITNQDDFLKEFELQVQACETFQYNERQSASAKDPFHDEFTSVSHLLCQLNSISEVTQLWLSSGVEYDAVAYLRPDVLFNCDFPLAALEDLEDGTAVIANFHHWRGGLNDRFLLAKPRVAEIWGDRLLYALGVCTMYDLHSESIVRRVLEHHKVEVQRVPFYFYRVRANGGFSNLDVARNGRERVPQCNPEEVRQHLEHHKAEREDGSKPGRRRRGRRGLFAA